MTWVTWRQHRLEALWAGVLAVLIGVAIAFVTAQLRVAGCSAPHSFCFHSDLAGQSAQWLAGFNLYTYALAFCPSLTGVFIAAPLVARELESGTHRLAWTQGVTRARWLFVKVVLVMVPLVAAAAVLGWLEARQLDVFGARVNRFELFDQQAPVTAASTLFALALGFAIGAIVRRSVPAMAVTLVAFVISRILIAEILRPNYLPPVADLSQDANSGRIASDPSAWILDRGGSLVDAAGHPVNVSALGQPDNLAQAMRDHGVYLLQHYQPGSRFWTFEWMEAAILCALALAVLGLAFYWVTRRLA